MNPGRRPARRGCDLATLWLAGAALLAIPAPEARGQQPSPRRAEPATFQPRPLSGFERRQAEWLLERRLPCLGCHRLRGAGGIIGPDLTEVGSRRSPGFLYGMVTDPAKTLPGSRMPRTPMPPRWAELVAQYLVSLRGSGTPAITDPAGVPGTPSWAALEDPAELYRQACAPCHGPQGRGDGYNAAHLPVRPTAHADSAYMATRPDDTLFDGIFAGGYILNRSARMPAFGETLSREQIWGLVRYLRELCRCRGPAWAGDGSGGASGRQRSGGQGR